MTVTISFDLIYYVGIMFLGLAAGYVGNFIASVLVVFLAPKLDGESVYRAIGVWGAAAAMLPIKLIISAAVAAFCMAHYDAVGEATKMTLMWTGGIGLAFSLLAGLGGRR